MTLPVRLTAAQARRIAVAAQGFSEPRPGGSITRAHLRRLISRIQVPSRVAAALTSELATMASWLGLGGITVGDRGDLTGELRSA